MVYQEPFLLWTPSFQPLGLLTSPVIRDLGCVVPAGVVENTISVAKFKD